MSIIAIARHIYTTAKIGPDPAITNFCKEVFEGPIGTYGPVKS